MSVQSMNRNKSCPEHVEHINMAPVSRHWSDRHDSLINDVLCLSSCFFYKLHGCHNNMVAMHTVLPTSGLLRVSSIHVPVYTLHFSTWQTIANQCTPGSTYISRAAYFKITFIQISLIHRKHQDTELTLQLKTRTIGIVAATRLKVQCKCALFRVLH